MRSLFVPALALVIFLELLASGGVEILGAATPALAPPWALALGVGLLSLAALRARGAVAMRGSLFLAALALLALTGYGMRASWRAYRAPLTPLVVRVSDTDRPEGGSALLELDSLDLSERRLLARLAGKRRNFALAIEGFLMVTQPGLHRFELDCDDWCELRLDGVALAGGEGLSSASRELEPGARRFELDYRQGSGPAFIELSWDPPGGVEVLPIESHLAGSLEAFDDSGFRFQGATRWVLLLSLFAWSVALAFVLVRGAESTRGWTETLKGWWRSEPSEASAIARPATWIGGSGVLAVVGAIARWTLPARLELLEGEYAVSPRRGPFVLERVEAFPLYVFFLAGLCLAVALLFRLMRTRTRTRTRTSGEASVGGVPPNRVRVVLLAAIAILLVWGGLVSQSEWVRYGRPCYDGYCDYAERVRDVMVDPSAASWARFRSHLAGNYHANSPVGPVAIAAASLLLGQTDVVPAYRAISALATLGTLFLLLVIARRELGLGDVAALVAAFLFVASGSVQRSFLFPQTDALAMFFVTFGVERTLAWTTSGGALRYFAASSTIALALLTKLSALPLAGIAFVLAARPFSEGWKTKRGAVRDLARGAALVAPPLLVTGAFVLSLRTADNVRTELHRIETLDSRLSFHVAATVVTLLPLLVSAALTLRRRWRWEELSLLGAVAIYLTGLWASGASGWERFYLNAMPLALPLAAGRLSMVRELRVPGTATILAAAYVVAHAVRMLMHLYNGA